MSNSYAKASARKAYAEKTRARQAQVQQRRSARGSSSQTVVLPGGRTTVSYQGGQAVVSSASKVIPEPVPTVQESSKTQSPSMGASSLGFYVSPAISPSVAGPRIQANLAAGIPQQYEVTEEPITQQERQAIELAKKEEQPTQIRSKQEKVASVLFPSLTAAVEAEQLKQEQMKTATVVPYTLRAVSYPRETPVLTKAIKKYPILQKIESTGAKLTKKEPFKTARKFETILTETITTKVGRGIEYVGKLLKKGVKGIEKRQTPLTESKISLFTSIAKLETKRRRYVSSSLKKTADIITGYGQRLQANPQKFNLEFASAAVVGATLTAASEAGVFTLGKAAPLLPASIVSKTPTAIKYVAGFTMAGAYLSEAVPNILTAANPYRAIGGELTTGTAYSLGLPAGSAAYKTAGLSLSNLRTSYELKQIESGIVYKGGTQTTNQFNFNDVMVDTSELKGVVQAGKKKYLVAATGIDIIYQTEHGRMLKGTQQTIIQSPNKEFTEVISKRRGKVQLKSESGFVEVQTLNELGFKPQKPAQTEYVVNQIKTELPVSINEINILQEPAKYEKVEYFGEILRSRPLSEANDEFTSIGITGRQFDVGIEQTPRKILNKLGLSYQIQQGKQIKVARFASATAGISELQFYNPEAEFYRPSPFEDVEYGTKAPMRQFKLSLIGQSLKQEPPFIDVSSFGEIFKQAGGKGKPIDFGKLYATEKQVSFTQNLPATSTRIVSSIAKEEAIQRGAARAKTIQEITNKFGLINSRKSNLVIEETEQYPVIDLFKGFKIKASGATSGLQPSFNISRPTSAIETSVYSIKPKTVPESLPKSLGRTLPRGLAKELPKSLPRTVPRTVPESLPKSLPRSLPRTLPRSLPQQLPRELTRSLPRSLPRGIPLGLEGPTPYETPFGSPFRYKTGRRRAAFGYPKIGRELEYQPSLVAIEYDVERYIKPKQKRRRRVSTGIEIRPILTVR